VLNNEPPPVRRARKPRSRGVLIAASVTLALVVPVVMAAAYWRYVNLVPPFTPSFPSPPTPNGYDEAARALQGFQAPDLVREEKWRNAPVSQLALVVARTAPYAAAIRRSFLMDWQEPSPLAAAELVPESRFYEIARCFLAEGRREWLQGNPEGALRCCVDALDLSGRVSSQSSQDLAMQDAQRYVAAAPLRGLSAQLKRVRRIRLAWPRGAELLEVNRQATLSRMTTTLQEFSAKSLVDQLDESNQTGGSGILPFSSMIPAGPVSRLASHDWETWKSVLTPRAYSIRVLDRHYQAMILRAGSPIRDGYNRGTLPDRWAERLSGAQMGGYRWEWPRHNLALMETAMAVRLFRLQQGRNPTSVQELVPDLLPAVPLDVWEQPVVVRLRNGRPVIYSIARDGVDNGGKAAEPSTFIEKGNGDAVWGKLCASDWPKPKRQSR
jgi:hypothetical protein